MVRVAIVDDQPMMRAALRTIVEAHGIDVVGEASDGDGALALAEREEPDVILMDVRMPGRDGISATSAIGAARPAVRVLVLTTFDDDDVLYGALAAGAAGFLLKNATPEDLVRAVRLAAAGDSVLDPAVTGRVLARLASGATPRSSEADAALTSLTERERDVLWLVTRGLTNAEVAATLGVGEATAKSHVSHVLAKLGVRDRVQAVIRAYELGFASAPRAIAPFMNRSSSGNGPRHEHQ